MDANLIQNLIDPVILFFFFGILAGALRSNLEIPPAIAKFFSLYLLMAIGLKGGMALAEAGLSLTAVLALGAAIIMATVIPAYSFFILKGRTNPYDAAAIAATYGSISAVTFIAAQEFLTRNGVEFGGYMTVAMVLMESPAIIMAVLLATYVRSREKQANATVAEANAPISMKAVLHEAFTDGAHLLLIGSLAIGFIAGDAVKALTPFTMDIFKGILAFFLLEMGLLVARQLRESRSLGAFQFGFAIIMPTINAMLALLLAWIMGLPKGDAYLLAILSASASYIVVPAVVRYAIPEARPGQYFTMSLGFTFPFNIIIGIPLYYAITSALWG
ncbi:MAG: sodium-dependent bicarbonate transport family permease [Halothiobacillaceae bacterium]